jgi:hypothetical protein
MLRSRWAQIGACFICLVNAGIVHAQQPAPTPVTPTPPVTAPPAAAPASADDSTEHARSAYGQGQAFFAQGDFAHALTAFQTAFDAVPNPIVLLSIAECAGKLGQIQQAVSALDKYLRLRPDAPDRAEVEQKRSGFMQMPAHLSVSSDPAGADVSIDAVVSGRKTPSLIDVPAGTHQLRVSLPGYEDSQESLQVQPGAQLERKIQLTSRNPKPPAPEPPPQPVAAVQPAPPPVAALWVTGSLGAAGLIAGTVLGVLALKEHSDYDAQPTKVGADRGERLAMFSDVGFGVGAMAIVTAAVLLLTHDNPETPAAADHAAKSAGGLASLQFVPNVGRDGASATAKVQF